MRVKTYNDVQVNVKFTKASTRTDINIVTEQNPTGETNENIALTLGKISKWYEALVPTGGSSGKILAWNSSGTAKWSDPLHPTITKSTDTTSTASPAHGGTFTAVDSVTRDDFGHVTKINTKTVTLPNDTKVSQSSTTTGDFRPIVLGMTHTTNPENLETTVADQTFVTKHVFVQPSTGNLTLYSTSGDSPSLIFRRGTMIDGELEWRIRDTSGRLEFDRDKSGSAETWENILKLDPSNNAMYFKGTAVSLNGHTHSVTVPASFAVKTGSSTQARITLQTLMTWLITTKAYIPAGAHRKLSLHTTWAYADNDILQFTVDGINYEMTLAGVVIEFDGYASDYQTGVFRLRIHSAPATNSFVLTDGYERFPLSHIAEYYCNGSDYTPIWKMLINRSDITSGTSTTGNGTISVVGKPVSVYGLGTAAYTDSTDYVPTSMLTVTKNTTVGIAPSSNAFGYVSGLTKAAWNFQQTDGTLISQYYNEKWQNEIYMDYRTGQMSTRGKNNGTWQDWRIQLDSGNFSSYAVPNTQTGMNAAINLLATGSSDPTLADYYIAQYAGGGTTTTTYHRRPISALWNTFRALITVNTTGSGNAITSVSIANDGNNRKLTFTKGSTFLTSHQSVTDGNPTLSWETQSTVATIGSTDIHVTMPPNPNTDEAVAQTADNSSNSDNYELLISNSANNTTETAGVRKSSRLRFNPSNGRVIMQGPLIVRATDGVGSYDEGIRINAGKNGFSTLAIGGSQDQLSAASDGQFWIGTNSTNSSYKRKLYIAHNGSTNSRTYFYAESSSQQSTSLRVGGDVYVTTSSADPGCKMRYNSTTQSLDFVFV